MTQHLIDDTPDTLALLSPGEINEIRQILLPGSSPIGLSARRILAITEHVYALGHAVFCGRQIELELDCGESGFLSEVPADERTAGLQFIQARRPMHALVRADLIELLSPT